MTSLRAPLLWLVVPMLTALYWVHWFGYAGCKEFWIMGGLLAAIVGVVWTKIQWLGGLGYIGLGLGFGLSTYELRREYDVGREGFPRREARLVVELVRIYRSTRPQRLSAVGLVVQAPQHLRHLEGKRSYMALEWRLSQEASKGMEVRVRGVLEQIPRRRETKGFDAYLVDAGVSHKLLRGLVERIEIPPPITQRYFSAMLQRMKMALETGVGAVKEGPRRTYAAMMLGDVGLMSSEQRELYSNTGALHLFAISGMHIVVIASSLRFLLLPLLGRGWRVMALELFVLWLFVAVTGCSASSVRAFHMVALLELSRCLERPSNALATLTLSILTVLVSEPHQAFGASFQLSYGIVAALILYGIPLQRTVVERWSPYSSLPRVAWTWMHCGIHTLVRKFLGAMSLGVAATVFGTLCALPYFGLVSPIALFVNLALIPLSTFVVLAGLLALLTSATDLELLTGVFNHGALLLLEFMEVLSRWALAIPGAHFQLPCGDSTLLGISIVVLVVLLLNGHSRGWRGGLGRLWIPPVYVAAVLGLLALS